MTNVEADIHKDQGLCCSLIELSRAAYEFNEQHRCGPQTQTAWMHQMIAVYAGRIYDKIYIQMASPTFPSPAYRRPDIYLDFVFICYEKHCTECKCEDTDQARRTDLWLHCLGLHCQYSIVLVL